MAPKAPFWTRPHLFVQIHSGSGAPYAVRVNTKKLVGMLLFLGVAYGACFTGSLLFFRELEVSRRLQEQVLEYETGAKLTQHLQSLSRSLAANVAGPQEPPSKSTASSAPAAAATATASAKPAAAESRPPASQSARIADIAVNCAEETCSAKLSMVPVSAGIAQGQLLVILETEIPRIGSASPSASIVRKRFFIYPGNETRDDLTDQELEKLAHKPFRFSRALQTTVKFQVGKLLRPLALNVYLFDSAGNRTHHERKVIEREE